MKFVFGLIFGLVVCFGVQAGWSSRSVRGAVRGESNYFSSLSRFQAAATRPAEISLVGSSITGRLSGVAGDDGIANLGSDGGSPLDGLRILASGIIRPGRWIIIEGNTLFNQVGLDALPVVDGVRSPWFQIGARLPAVSFSSRPTAMMYSNLLGRHAGEAGSIGPFVVGQDQVANVDEGTFTGLERERLDQLSEQIERLQQRGCRLVVVILPGGVQSESALERMHRAAAALCGRRALPYFDLERQIPRGSLEFTDGVHLAPASAARMIATLRQVVEGLERASAAPGR